MVKTFICMDCHEEHEKHVHNQLRCPRCQKIEARAARKRYKEETRERVRGATLAKVVDYRGTEFEDETFVLDWLHWRIMPIPHLKRGIKDGLYPVGMVVEIMGERQIVSADKQLVAL